MASNRDSRETRSDGMYTTETQHAARQVVIAFSLQPASFNCLTAMPVPAGD